MRRISMFLVVTLLGMMGILPAAPVAAEEIAIVRIVQDTVPHHPHNFRFRGELGRFRLDDDANGTLPRLRVFEITNPTQQSPIRVRQVPNEAHWPLIALNCSDHETVTDFAAHTAWIHVQPGERIRCVWVNHRV